jgi:peptide deformylase
MKSDKIDSTAVRIKQECQEKLRAQYEQDHTEGETFIDYVNRRAEEIQARFARSEKD